MYGGGRFPGARGGSWNGVLFEPTLGISGTSLSGSSISGSMLSWRVGAALGWQYIHFKKMQQSTAKQPGNAFALGAYVGAEGDSSKTTISDPVLGDMSSSSSTTNPSYGPLLRYSSMKYNPGTARASRFDVTLLVLPTGNFLFGMVDVAWGF
jgi:hypothetical protein